MLTAEHCEHYGFMCSTAAGMFLFFTWFPHFAAFLLITFHAFFYWLNKLIADVSWDKTNKKTGRHLVFSYWGTVSTFFLFERLTQEMRDLHHATCLPPSTFLCHFFSSPPKVLHLKLTYNCFCPGWRGRRGGWKHACTHEGFRGQVFCSASLVGQLDFSISLLMFSFCVV